MRKTLPVFLAVGLLAGCAAPLDEEETGQTSDAIVGGSRTSDVPAIGYLAETITTSGAQRRELFCTGTLIAPDVVLTAAHCVVGTPIRSLVFGTGAFGGTVTAARSAQIHPDYRAGPGGYAHDIAYVLLQAPVRNVRPATIRRTAHRGTCEYVATGYGVHVEGHEPGDLVTDADLGQRRSLAMCADAGYFDTGMIRAYSGRGTPCSADSGGPLRIASSTQLIGVVSYTTDDCVAAARVYYAPVASNLAFIDAAIARSAR